MAVRQYIGARYVPKFVGDWDDSVSYEALSIVMDNNETYTSKIPVPAGVPLSDTKYWAMTGSYNGAIRNLQDEMQSLEVKAGAFVRPEEFGAVGDGTADDTTAVDQCIRYAIANNKIVIITGNYRIGQIDLRDVSARICNLHIEGQNYAYSLRLNDDPDEYTGKVCGFTSYASGSAFIFPSLHMAILKNFTIDAPQGTYAFEFYGALYAYIDAVAFGFYCNGFKIHAGVYWTITNCVFNTRVPHSYPDLHFLNILNDYSSQPDHISASEYYFLENCAINNNRSGEGGVFSEIQSAVVSRANNYTVFHHCDFMAWGAIYELANSFGNSKNVKFMECNLGSTHIIRNLQDNNTHGINGLLIDGCNIGVTKNYFDFGATTNFNLARFVFTNNSIDVKPTLKEGTTSLMPANSNKRDWSFLNNMYLISAADYSAFPPLTDIYIRSVSEDPPAMERETHTVRNVTGAAIESGIAITHKLRAALVPGAPVKISAAAANTNTGTIVQLDVSDATYDVTNNTVTITVSKSGLTGYYNVVAWFEY